MKNGCDKNIKKTRFPDSELLYEGSHPCTYFLLLCGDKNVESGNTLLLLGFVPGKEKKIFG